MRFHPRSLLLVCTLFFLSAFAVPEAEACRCFGARNSEGKNFQPCGLYWRSDAVFIGTVQTITLETETVGEMRMPGTLTAYFSVDKAVRGVEGKSISVRTNGSGGMCGFPFKEGESYFVYVSINEKGELEAHLCGGTVLLKDAQADLEYLKAIEAGEKGARVYGTVSRVVRPSTKDGWGPVGLSGIQISMESIDFRFPTAANQPKYVKGEFDTVTDADGFYIFYNIPDGVYSVKPKIPPPLRPFGDNKPGDRSLIRVDSDKDRCGSSRFAVTSLATVEGRALNSDGSTPPQQYIWLFPVDEDGKIQTGSYNDHAWIKAEDGRYLFDKVAPGRYILSVNPKDCPIQDAPQYGRSYFPGVPDPKDAKIILVGDNDKVKVRDYTLPPVRGERSFSGTVYLADGSPAIDATVFLADSDVSRCMQLGAHRETRTDAEGKFELKALEGYRYKLRAYMENRSTNQQRIYSEIFELPESRGLQKMKLVLGKTN